MFVTGIVPVHVESMKWQDYRSTKKGMVVYYNSDPASELPIREVPEEIPSKVVAEPNYETKTFGLYGCKHSKIRSVFVKGKTGYIFFMTKYAGTIAEHLNNLVVTGYYRIKWTADAQKMHIRYLDEYSCINDKGCLALRASEMKFVSIEDAFKLNAETLKAWGCKTRITRQSKILLDEDIADTLIKYLDGKKDISDTYIDATLKLMPQLDDDDDDDDDE